MQGLKFVATGRCLPETVVTNEDFTRYIDTSDEWIKSRTGISERRFCKGETGLSMAVCAAKKALEAAGISREDIGACIVLTVSPDFLAPTTACLLQKELGLSENILSMDMNVGCTGFLYGLHVIRGLLMQGKKPYGLVIAAEVLSRLTDFTDRSTCVLFGDGAGAAVVTLDNAMPYFYTAGCRGDEAISIQGPGKGRPLIRMDGQAVFRFAVEILPRCVNDLLEQAGLAIGDVAWIIPHQANRRIIETAARRLKLPMEQFYQNMQNYGNTSAASIPLALDEMNEKGLLQRGQKIILAGFGAGLTWGGILMEW